MRAQRAASRRNAGHRRCGTRALPRPQFTSIGRRSWCGGGKWLDITLDGRTVHQSWPLMDRRQHPLLEEVVDRLFSVRIEDARTVRVDWRQPSYSTR